MIVPSFIRDPPLPTILPSLAPLVPRWVLSSVPAVPAPVPVAAGYFLLLARTNRATTVTRGSWSQPDAARWWLWLSL
jgi:hypothetical protein